MERTREELGEGENMIKMFYIKNFSIKGVKSSKSS